MATPHDFNQVRESTPELCPKCGSRFVKWLSTCPNCHWDPESLAEKYRGTPWATDAGFETSAASRTGRRGFWRSLVLSPFTLVLVGVVAVLAVIVAIKAGALPEVTLDRVLASALLFLIPVVVGQLSLAVPGRKARGAFKGCLLSYVSLQLAWIPVLIAWSELVVFDYWHLSTFLIVFTLCLVGTLVVRLLLFFFETPEY